MRKSTQLQNVGAIAAQEVYKALNIEPTNRRNPEQTQVRAAIGTVLRSYMSDTNTSKVLGRDRSTVCYYVRNHETNMTHWKGYAQKYNTAHAICEMHMTNVARDYDLSVIDRRISQYENKIQNLKEERDRLISSPSSQ